MEEEIVEGGKGARDEGREAAALCVGV